MPRDRRKNKNTTRNYRHHKNKTLIQNLRNVEIEDVLGREQIVLNNESIGELIKGNTILVTGGGDQSVQNYVDKLLNTTQKL